MPTANLLCTNPFIKERHRLLDLMLTVKKHRVPQKTKTNNDLRPNKWPERIVRFQCRCA